MKKVLAFVLAFVAVFSLGVCAFATDSPHGGGGGGYVPERTSVLPDVVKVNGVVFTSFNDKADLSDAQQTLFKDAKAAVSKGAPDGMTSRYFFFAESKSYPVDVTIRIKNVSDVVTKLYSNGSWTELKTVANGDEYTFSLTGEGPVAIYTK